MGQEVYGTGEGGWERDWAQGAFSGKKTLPAALISTVPLKRFLTPPITSDVWKSLPLNDFPSLPSLKA